MGALSFSVTDHGTAFGLCFDLPWIQTTFSQAAYFPRLACNQSRLLHGYCPPTLSTDQLTCIILPLSLAGLKIMTGRKE